MDLVRLRLGFFKRQSKIISHRANEKKRETNSPPFLFGSVRPFIGKAAINNPSLQMNLL